MTNEDWTMKTQPGGLDIEDGTYKLKLVALEKTEIDSSAYGKGKQPGVKLHFVLPDVLDADGEASAISALATRTLSPKAKLWRWYEALTGETLEMDQDINLATMIGKEAMAAIMNKPSAKDGTLWARIEDLIALPKTGRKAKADNPFEGFLQADGKIDWDNFAGRCSSEGITGLEVATFMGVPKASGPAIQKWVEAEAGRSLIGLIMDVKRQKVEGLKPDPEELPFE